MRMTDTWTQDVAQCPGGPGSSLSPGTLRPEIPVSVPWWPGPRPKPWNGKTWDSKT